MDIGLIVSVAVALAAAEALALFRPPVTTEGGPIDAGLWAALTGVVVGRMAAMALDDPQALGGLRDLAALRGGVEFWPGVAAGVVVLVVAARFHHLAVGHHLADLAPFGLMAAAGYQATCFVREGCFGPTLQFGSLSDGGTVLPVEPVGALVLAALAVMLSLRVGRWSSWLVVILAVWGLGLQRAVVSFWLPVVGGGLSRAHRESLVVTVVSAVALIVVVTRSRQARAAVGVAPR